MIRPKPSPDCSSTLFGAPEGFGNAEIEYLLISCGYTLSWTLTPMNWLVEVDERRSDSEDRRVIIEVLCVLEGKTS
jgi:hypothetical protein